MKKGFTLVELLIVIGILAILTAAVVVILNPAELLRQARDSQRFSDLDSVKNAIALYLVDVSGTLSVSSSTANCFVYDGDATVDSCATRFASVGTPVVGTTRAVDGTGWISVDFSAISGGSPLSVLPVDPTHSGINYYAYKGTNSNLTFEINAALESTKYATVKSANDGGAGGASTTVIYEVGTDISL